MIAASRTRHERRAALRRFMKEHGLTVAAWSKAADVNDSTLRAFISGRSHALRQDTLEKLARSQGVTISEMIGERAAQDAAPLPHNVIALPSLDVRASMGGGIEVLEEPEGPPFYFRREWIEGVMRGRAGRLHVIPDLSGDSMRPTINDHDIGVILVPHALQSVVSGRVYALWDGTGLVVKRLEPVLGREGMLRVVSDNPTYPPYEVHADQVKIIGELVWRGGHV